MSIPITLAPPPAQAQLATKDGNFMGPDWVRWFQVIRFILHDLPVAGPYANDAAAKAAGIVVGHVYYQPTGAVVVRLT